jgi:ligand-binding SRPBCC domain-containing protein
MSRPALAAAWSSVLLRRSVKEASIRESTFRLQRRVELNAPLEDVFRFFSRAENLEEITPPWLHFRILTPPPILMEEGAAIDYTLRLYGIPVLWKTRIADWEPPRSFRDIQIKGPYEIWEHRHLFEPTEQGTLMTDIVDYAPPGGPLSPFVNALFVKGRLQKIFDYRSERMCRLFPPRR